MTLSGIWNVVKPEHQQKALSSIEVTLEGMVIDVRVEQLLKALALIVVTPASEIVDSVVHWLKACCPIVVVPFIVNDVKWEQPLNADGPMVATFTKLTV